MNQVVHQNSLTFIIWI